tara:strand:+ start:6282 stop:7376 length:1095 start_codon:yes stop_codon:yes gene_type:complete
MTFINIKMQNTLWGRMILSKKNGRVGNAYLFSGPNGSAKEALALKFSAYLNCNEAAILPCGTCSSCKRIVAFQHENCHLIVPMPSDKQMSVSDKQNTFLTEKKYKSDNPFHKISIPKSKTIPISLIRNLKKELFLKSVDSGRKIVLIFDAHNLCVGDGSSANAILKILEEPPANTTFILVSDYKGQLLPTILSRCQIINFPPLQNNEIISYLSSEGFDNTSAEFAAIMSEGNMNYAQKISKNGIEEIKQLVEKLTDTLTVYDEKNWRSFIQDYSRMAQSNFNDYKFHLFLLQCWLKQARNKHNALNDENLFMKINKNFNSSFPNARLDQINHMIEKIINAPNKNLFMPIQLTNFLIGVQKRLFN